LDHPESKQLNYKVIAKIDKKNADMNLIKVLVHIDVTPGLFTNQQNPNIRISLEKVTCKLVLETKLKSGDKNQ
jgi:hypothetical protein